MAFNLVPVTHTASSRGSYVRVHHDVVVSVSEKRGIMTLTFSPEFLEKVPSLAVGTACLIAVDNEAMKMMVAPADGETQSTRKIRKVPGFANAGKVVIPLRNLDGFKQPASRTPLEWVESEEQEGAVVLQF